MVLEELWQKGDTNRVLAKVRGCWLHLCKVISTFMDLALKQWLEWGGGGEGFEVGHEGCLIYRSSLSNQGVDGEHP